MRVTLCDFSPGCIAFAREKAEEANLPLAAFAVDARNIASLTTESFDHVLLMGPLYHLLEAHERETAMCAALSRLKPGGTIAVSFIGSYSGMLYAMRAFPEVILRAKEQEYFENRQAFAGTGFTDVYFERHQHVLPFMGKFQLETLHFLSSESFFAPCSDRLYAQSEETATLWHSPVRAAGCAAVYRALALYWTKTEGGA